jgi:hypothetical protein
MIRATAVALLLITSAGIASAHDHKSFNDGPIIKALCEDFPRLDKRLDKTTICAPEMDPGAAMSGLTLLMGGLAVLRGRRSKPTPKQTEEV